MASQELINRLEEKIENVSDFPVPGIQFKDISPIFLDPKLYEDVITDLVAFSKGKIDAVCGIESRGYLFGIAIAVALEVPFILIRKAGKLPPPVIAEKYDLEYGSAVIETREGQIKPGQRILVHDDLSGNRRDYGSRGKISGKAKCHRCTIQFPDWLKRIERSRKTEKIQC